MGHGTRTVKVSTEVYARLVGLQKTLAEEFAQSNEGASARMVVPTLGSVIEIALNGFEKGRTQ